MKLNKKLLMAALAGAIVVGGGVGSFAEDAADAPKVDTGAPKVTDEGKGMYKPDPNDKLVGEKFHKDLQEAKDKAIQEAKANGITSEFLLKNIKNAKTIESVKSFAEELINSHASSSKKDRLKGEDLEKAIKKVKEEEEAKKEPGDDIPEDSPFYRQTPFAYITKEEAEQAAKKALENELLNPGHINNGYEVARKADGNWDYVLKIVDKSEDKTPEKPSNPDVKPNPSTQGRQPSTPEGPYAPYEPSTPGKEEKEDKKPEDKKPGETKKPEDKKPGEDKKPEDKKPGEDKKPEDKKPGKKEKENTDSPNKKNKKKLPKAGSEAEIVTLAAAALSTAAGAFISLKKRK